MQSGFGGAVGKQTVAAPRLISGRRKPRLGINTNPLALLSPSVATTFKRVPPTMFGPRFNVWPAFAAQRWTARPAKPAGTIPSVTSTPAGIFAASECAWSLTDKSLKLVLEDPVAADQQVTSSIVIVVRMQSHDSLSVV